MLDSVEELRVFAQIVESGSISGAARALGMPVNTASRRLAALEERVGERLLFRTTRSNSLTEPGRVLLRRALRVLAEVDAAEAELKPVGLAGLLRVALPSVTTRLGLLDSCAAWMESHPGLRLSVRITDQPLNPITEGLDLVVHGGPAGDSRLIRRELSPVDPVLAAAPSYVARCGSPDTPEALREHACLRFVSDTPEAHWSLVRGKEQRIIPVEGRFESDHSRTLHDAVYAGLGVGLVTARELRRGQAQGRLLPVLPGWRHARFQLMALYPSSRRGDPRVRGLLGLIEDQLRAQA